MMNSKDARRKTIELVTECLGDLLQDLGICGEDDSIEYASMLINDYQSHMELILNMPHGGALSPEELAESILVHHLRNLLSSRARQESAALLHR